MTLTLTLHTHSTVPLEVEGVTPDAVHGMTPDQVRRLPIYQGNQTVELGEFFRVEGDPSDNQMVWEGMLEGVHWIGAKMAAGRIEIRGSAGRHVGSQMQGGTIEVFGNVGDWVGAEMRGGSIFVRGNAGHLAGAAYRGSAQGMNRGTLLIWGNAGNEIGHSLRRGLIAVGGQVGDLVGWNLLAGTILVFGNCGIRHGAGMKRGTIGLLGPEPPPLLPTFRRACRYRPLVALLFLRKLRGWGFPVPEEILEADIVLYRGDMLEGGRGEIWTRADLS
ncbi:MAG: formylmethanofuran dehydrogenase subunit C [Pirellulaceae bacterium]|nr:MAG: formylmethanofuran dehydrogenase subunit C [Pirellulaceae bacterium]